MGLCLDGARDEARATCRLELAEDVELCGRAQRTRRAVEPREEERLRLPRLGAPTRASPPREKETKEWTRVVINQ